MQHRDVRKISTIVPRRAHEFGGKVKNLAALSRAGFPVPMAYGVSSRVAHRFLSDNLAPADLPDALAFQEHVAHPRLQAIAARVRESTLSPSIQRSLADAFVAMRSDFKKRNTSATFAIAVRSSALYEDAHDASSAGLHETILNVRSEDELFDAVRSCWSSTYSPRVMSYLHGLGQKRKKLSCMGLALQEMVPAEVAGVMFTVNPLTGDAGELVINAAYGLGSAVVSGRVSPDTLRIDKATRGPRDRIIGDKQIRCVMDPAGSVRDEEVSAEERGQLCLDESVALDLVELGLRVERHFGDARDIEWAYAHGHHYLLQARPVTTHIQPATTKWHKRSIDHAERSDIVWSNVNVGEALPGVATPFTWSILSAFSELGFRRAFGSLGCTVPKNAELVGNFRGRIYLNLSEFMGILSQVPGLSPKLLLSLAGGGGVERLEMEQDARSSVGFLSRLPLTVSKFGRENYNMDKRVARFETMFAHERSRIGRVDPRILSPTALANLLADAESLLDEAGAVMLTVYGNLLSSVVLLAGALNLVFGDDAEAIQRDLLTGLADIESAAPGLSLFHIAQMARREEEVLAYLKGCDPLTASVQMVPQGPSHRALETFLKAYGHRGTREAEIAEPRWSDDPTLLFATLQIHLTERDDVPYDRPIDVERRQRAVRERADALLAERIPLPLKPAMRHLLSRVKRFMRLRERLRGYVTEVLGMFRRIAMDASRRIEAQDPEAGPDAAFFLTIEELRETLNTASVRVAPRVVQRRIQYQRDCRLSDPPDSFVGFPPPVQETIDESSATLSGISASSGVREGQARIVVTPADAANFKRGEILVAGCADVGWSPLFLVASAVVTDLGGPLSHAAIVLREFGVPSVVNVKHGTARIQNGDWLRVDGDRGEVTILGGEPSA